MRIIIKVKGNSVKLYALKSLKGYPLALRANMQKFLEISQKFIKYPVKTSEYILGDRADKRRMVKWQSRTAEEYPVYYEFDCPKC